MAKSKLPPYDELKKLVLNEGMSYAAVATKYKVHHDSVYQALKYGANRYGEPWPFEQDTLAKIRTGLMGCSMPSEGLAFILDEAYRKAREVAREAVPGESVLVPLTALDRAAPKTNLSWKTGPDGVRHINTHHEVWPKENATVHRPGCSTVRAVDCLTLSIEEAEAWAFSKCGLCFDLTTARWCIDNGWTNSYIRGILDGRFDRVRIVNARAIMQKLGEPIPKNMKNWQPRSHNWDKRKWEKRRSKRAA